MLWHTTSFAAAHRSRAGAGAGLCLRALAGDLPRSRARVRLRQGKLSAISSQVAALQRKAQKQEDMRAAHPRANNILLSLSLSLRHGPETETPDDNNNATTTALNGSGYSGYLPGMVPGMPQRIIIA